MVSSTVVLVTLMLFMIAGVLAVIHLREFLRPVVGEGDVFIGVLAGAITGFCEAVIMFPMENIKIQQQLKRSNMIDIAKVTYNAHGIAGFYRGITPVLAGAIPSQALRWGIITGLCGLLSGTTDKQRGATCGTVRDTFVAALVAGLMVSLLVGVPLDTMKTEAIHKLHQSRTSPSRHPRNRSDAALDPDNADDTVIVVHSDIEDVPPLPVTKWRGLLPVVLKKIINQIIRFPAHHMSLLALCAMFLDHSGPTEPTCRAADHIMLSFFSGAIAGCSSILVTQPLDVVKTKLQGLPNMQKVVYRHSLHCARHIVSEEGWTALFDGMVARTIRASLGAALTFSIFPVVQRLLTATE
jgi:hypothetical protein